MRKVDIHRKRPSGWPIVVGAVLLLGIGWGVTRLLRAEPEPPPPAVPAIVSDSLRPAAIPMAPSDPGATPGLTGVAPLDDGDVGREVRASGTVVATGDGAFWLLVDGRVLQVESPRGVRSGDRLAIEGRLQPSDPDLARRIADEVLGRSPDSGDWVIVDRIKLVETGAGPEP